MNQRAVIIVNPVAGKKKGKDLVCSAAQMLASLSYDTLLFVTSKRGDATEAAARFADECALVVVIGGDGTLNEVISGLIGREKKPDLCYLPAGSTNDFAAALGIPGEIAASGEAIRAKSLFPVDIGCFDERYFTYIASFGIFTRASYSADQNVKNVLGHFAYVLEGAKELPDLKKIYHVRVTCDGAVTEGDYIFGSVSNTTMMGGIFPLPPERVSLSDGLFEVMLVKPPKGIDGIAKDYSMMKNGNFDGESIVFLQGKDVTVSSSEPIAWCTDGEYAGERKEIRARNLPGAVRIYVKQA